MFNRTKYVRVPPSRQPIKFTFTRPVESATTSMLREPVHPPDLSHSTDTDMLISEETPAPAAEAPATGKRLHPSLSSTPGHGFRSGEIARVSLMPATRTPQPETDANEAVPHFCTTAVRLLDRFFSAAKGTYWTGIRVADEARISGIQLSPHECSIGKCDYFRLDHDLAPATKVHKGHHSRFFPRPGAADPSHIDVAEKVKQEALRWTSEIRAEAHRQHLVVVFDPRQFQPTPTAQQDNKSNQDGDNPTDPKRAKTLQPASIPSRAQSDRQDTPMHDKSETIDPRSRGPLFPSGFYLAVPNLRPRFGRSRERHRCPG